MVLIKWFFSDMRRVLFFAILILISALLWSYDARIKLNKENDRISENFDQVQKTNQVLNVTLDEYKNLNLKTKIKLDSVLAINKIKPRTIKSATIINLEYKDTTPAEILYLKPEIEPASKIYSIPFTSANECWGIEGLINSLDPKSSITITKRTASNSAQLIVVKKKKFLFWTIRPEQYKGFNDCGEMNFTQINIVKK